MEPREEHFLVAPDRLDGSLALLLEWQVEEGESLRKGQPVGALVDGEGCSTLFSPVDGRLLEHWVEEGAAVGAGQRLARLLPEPTRSGIDSAESPGGQNSP